MFIKLKVLTGEKNWDVDHVKNQNKKKDIDDEMRNVIRSEAVRTEL